MKKLILTLFMMLGLCNTSSAQTTQGCLGVTVTMPAGQLLACSRTVIFSGTGTGGDMVFLWSSVTGQPAGSWNVPPWEPYPISIYKVEITDTTPGDGHLWWMVGNDYTPDPMGYLGAGENEREHSFPPGIYWPFPSNVSPPAGAYFDVHGQCASGVICTVRVTFHYIVNATFPTPPPPFCTTFNSLNPADKAAGITLSNGNRTAVSSGAATHEMVRAVTGIAPSTLKAHYEWTISGNSNPAIDIVGLQDGSVATNVPVGNAGTGFGVGYNTSLGYVYDSNFLPAPAGFTSTLSGVYAMDYDSFSGVATVTGPSGYSTTRTLSVTPITLFPAVSMYNSASSSVTYNFGSSAFSYAVPTGYQPGLCQ